MSSLYSSFKTNTNIEKTGIDLQYGSVVRDGKEVPILITIARAGGSNARFEKTFEHKTKPYKRMIQTDTLDPEVGKRIMLETYAETVILGWENVADESGEFLEFTKENVIKVMTDLPDLFSDIQVQANKAALFRAEVIAADIKN